MRKRCYAMQRLCEYARKKASKLVERNESFTAY
jgi:hypothetical protein